MGSSRILWSEGGAEPLALLGGQPAGRAPLAVVAERRYANIRRHVTRVCAATHLSVRHARKPRRDRREVRQGCCAYRRPGGSPDTRRTFRPATTRGRRRGGYPSRAPATLQRIGSEQGHQARQRAGLDLVSDAYGEGDSRPVTAPAWLMSSALMASAQPLRSQASREDANGAAVLTITYTVWGRGEVGLDTDPAGDVA